MEFWRQEQQLQQMEELTLRQEMAAKQQQMAAEQLAAERAQREQQMAMAREQRQQQQQRKTGFNWGKALAMGAGFVAGGGTELAAETQANMISGIIQDSMPGVDGVSNMRAAAQSGGGGSAALSSGFGQSSAAGGAGGGLPRSNYLFTSGYGTCSTSNNQQLASLCQGADVYYQNYRNVFLSQGAAAAEPAWQAHVMAAKNALRWRNSAQSSTGIAPGRTSTDALRSRQQTTSPANSSSSSTCDTPSGRGCVTIE
jgi:hypothetical protein